MLFVTHYSNCALVCIPDCPPIKGMPRPSCVVDINICLSTFLREIFELLHTQRLYSRQHAASVEAWQNATPSKVCVWSIGVIYSGVVVKRTHAVSSAVRDFRTPVNKVNMDLSSYLYVWSWGLNIGVGWNWTRNVVTIFGFQIPHPIC